VCGIMCVCVWYYVCEKQVCYHGRNKQT